MKHVKNLQKLERKKAADRGKKLVDCKKKQKKTQKDTK